MKNFDKSFTPKAYIFDLDGTLCDTMPDLMLAMNNMLLRLGYATRSEEELLSFINHGNRYFVYKSLPDGIADSPDCPIVTEAMKINAEEYEKCYCHSTREYAGISDMLLKLKESGAALAILSNKRDPFVKKLSNALFNGIFDISRGNIDGQIAKPAPDPAWEVAEALGVSPEECVFIGDSDVDMKTAVNAGMLPVGVAWGYRSPECLMENGAKLIINTPGDLCEKFL